MYLNSFDRKPLFPGNSCFPLSPDSNPNLKRNGFPVSNNDQLNIIFDIIGSPSEEDISFVTDQKALDYLKSFPFRNRADLSQKFPGLKEGAIDFMNEVISVQSLLQTIN